MFQEDDLIWEFFPGSRRVSNLFICLVIYLFSSPATPPSSLSSSLSHRLHLEKTLRLRRNCLPRSWSIGREAPPFLPGVLHRHSHYLESQIETSKLTRSWRRQLEIVMSPFFVTMVYAIRKRKVVRSLRGTQDYVSTLRIVDT